MSLVVDLARNVLDGALLGPSLPLRHVSRLLGRSRHEVRIRGAGRMVLRPGTSDSEVIADIFRRGAYDFSWLRHYNRVLEAYEKMIAAGRTPIIIDAGANIGAASIWFCKMFPAAKVLAVEPDADNLSILRLNAVDRNITIVPAAIGSERGTVSLRNPQNAAWSVQTERDVCGRVPVVTIADVMLQHAQDDPLFLVKIDIEGFESDLFSKNLEWLDGVEVVIIEPHDWMLPGRRTSKAFQTAMLERDFELIISGENLIYLKC